MEWTKFWKKGPAEARPYVEGEPLTHVTCQQPPMPGDWIARDPNNHDDQWLLTKAYFEAYYEPRNE